jgi:hypothetical protein
MTRVGLVTALMTVIGLAACGGDDGEDVRTVTVPATVAPAETSVSETAVASASAGGDAILIETRITDARRHRAEVIGGSVIGETAFCRGGTASGGSDGPTITTTFHCAGGTLTVQFAPTQPSSVQGSVWEIVAGTGRFDGLHGGGSMVATFKSDDPDAGREVFTGTVAR